MNGVKTALRPLRLCVGNCEDVRGEWASFGEEAIWLAGGGEGRVQCREKVTVS